MKRKILFVIGLICMTISFHSSDELSNCEVCQQNIYDNQTGSLVTEGNEAEYCDAELIAIKAIADVNVGGKTTNWECR